MKNILVSLGLVATTFTMQAQMAKDNPCKFLGNITTSYNWTEYADAQECSTPYYQLWNQITSENGCKWGSINTSRGTFNWSNADRAYNYAKEHGFPLKFHCLIWGSQHPTWIESLDAATTRTVIEEWFDAVQKHFPDLELIDVVNEAICVNGKYHSPYEETKIVEALGGTGKTGYDWIIEAFKMARKRWPNAKLIYNDYNTFRWQKSEFITLVKALIDGGAPIDAYGAQSHDLTDMEFSEFKKAMDETQAALKIPMYITEYDIGTSDDALQLQRYKEQIPYMWEADYVAGVTLWGWIYGKTWTPDGNSGIIRSDGSERPAFTWLKEYMASDAAKNAKGPFCDGLSVQLKIGDAPYIIGEEIKIAIEANSEEVDHIDIFANDELLVNKYMTPYEWSYTPSTEGSCTIKIVAYGKDGESVTQSKELNICPIRVAYSGEPVVLPGTIEAEHFDIGCEGDAFHDSDETQEGDGSRNDCGVDVVKGNDGEAIGYTAADEWLEYTVQVEQEGHYTYDAIVSSGNANSGFHLSLNDNGTLTDITSKIEVPQGEDWSTYSHVKGDINTVLKEGQQTMRLTIDGSYCNIDKIEFNCTDCDATSIIDTKATEAGTYKVFTTLGRYIGTIHVSEGENISRLLFELVNSEGCYLLQNETTTKSKLYLSKK